MDGQVNGFYKYVENLAGSCSLFSLSFCCFRVYLIFTVYSLSKESSSCISLQDILCPTERHKDNWSLCTNPSFLGLHASL